VLHMDQGSIMMPPSTPRAFKWQVINRACATHTEATSKPQVRYLVHTENVREYYFIYSQPHQLRHTSRCNGSTSNTPCAAAARLQPHALYVGLVVRREYSSPAARALRRPRRAPRLLVFGRTRSTSTSSCAATTRLRLHALYVNLVVHREYSSPLSRLQRSTSTSPRIRVPRHVARLVRRLVALPIVDYSGLVVDYFTSAAASGCLGMSRGSSCSSSRRSSSTTRPRAGSSSTTSPSLRG
jgi:hypothetical protein